MAKAPRCEICKQPCHYFSGPTVTIIEEGKRKKYHKQCWNTDRNTP